MLLSEKMNLLLGGIRLYVMEAEVNLVQSCLRLHAYSARPDREPCGTTTIVHASEDSDYVHVS